LPVPGRKKGRRANPAAVGRKRRGLLAVLFGHGGLAGEADLAVVLDAEHLDPDFLAHLDDVFRAVDAEVGELADVDEAFLAGEELGEAAEVLDAGDGAR
jgi:hypothetical protein